MKLTARVCQVCGKPLATLAYAWQDPSGKMVSIYAHRPCLAKLRQGRATLKSK